MTDELPSAPCNVPVLIVYSLGNNVPQDILKAISVAIKLNGEREAARNKENARTEKMIRTIEKIELENTMQVHTLHCHKSLQCTASII